MKLSLLGVLVALLLLGGCTSAPPPVLMPQGTVLKSLHPDSVRVKFTMQVATPSGNEELDGVLWAIPQQKYRLELSGAMGVGAASILWTKQGWTAYLPTEDKTVEGLGDTLQIPGLHLPLVSIHDLVAPLWGDWHLPDSNHARSYLLGERWIVESTPEILPAMRAEWSADKLRLLAVEYPSEVADWQLRLEADGNAVRVVQGGHWLMTLTPQEVRSDLSWKPAIWRM